MRSKGKVSEAQLSEVKLSKATHLSLDATCQATADNTHETDATRNGYANAQVKHLRQV